MSPHCHAGYDDEAHLVLVQGSQQGPQVELAQRAEAAPLIALICLQRAWRRASRSLMLSDSACSRRTARARAKSPMSSPLRTLSGPFALTLQRVAPGDRLAT